MRPFSKDGGNQCIVVGQHSAFNDLIVNHKACT